MYMSSSELQYIVELSGQGLLHVPNTDDADIPVSKRLQLLRDKAHAWFKVDARSFETVSLPRNMVSDEKFIADGHIYAWNKEDTAAIIPILPKASQKTFKRDWSPRTLFSVLDSRALDVFMDPAQNLIATAYVVTHQSNDETLYIELRDLGSDDVHPQATGRTLSVSLPRFKNNFLVIAGAKLKGFGSYIALRSSFILQDEDVMWQLNIWNWQHSTTSNSVLKGRTGFPSNAIDFCFLGNNRLLVVDDDLKLYSIENMPQTPQLLARFLTPVHFLNVRCFLPVDHIEDSSPQTQAQQIMYTSDPQNRLLCIKTRHQVYIISTRIFFNLDRMTAATSIPWECWGPSNTRIFAHSNGCKTRVNGNRVLQVSSVNTLASGLIGEHILHMMDFSPLAVTNRRGLGRVVKEPSTIGIDANNDGVATSLTSFLSYVEVIFTRKLGSAESVLADVWVDKDRIYLLNRRWVGFAQPETNELEVIDI